MTEQMQEVVAQEEVVAPEGNLVMAIVGGAVACVAMVALAYVWFWSGLLHGLLTGMAVGLLVQKLGRGRTLPFGVVGIVFGLVGTFLSFLLVSQMNEALFAQETLWEHLKSQSAFAPVEVFFKDYFVFWHGLGLAAAAFEGYSIGTRKGW